MVVVRDEDKLGREDERIDKFTFPLSTPLSKFNISNSFTVQGDYRLGNLTLSYGNLTADPTPCNSMDSPMSSISTQTQQGRCPCTNRNT